MEIRKFGQDMGEYSWNFRQISVTRIRYRPNYFWLGDSSNPDGLSDLFHIAQNEMQPMACYMLVFVFKKMNYTYLIL